MYTATFQSGLLTIQEMLMNLNCLFLLLIHVCSIHISGPATVQNQNL